ncbi:MAG: tRNA 5-methoxyuridine(34)/uridine 5-oxyacetic acid(34) synthase CmoB [Arenicellales bacterium]
MIDSNRIRASLCGTCLDSLTEIWINRVNQIFVQQPHGDWTKWLTAIRDLPNIQVDKVDLNCSHITVQSDAKVERDVLAELKQNLMLLHPWRKGPFNLFGLTINSEWRSDMKWSRIKDSISSLDGRLVLDVGCGNGYYLWRMLGAGARIAMGIDPTQLFLAQFEAIARYVNVPNAFILPIKSEDLVVPGMLGVQSGFDTVFSMGIYYHRREPIDHLRELFRILRPGGELVLETLIIEGQEDRELIPHERYAQMRNVWSLPTVIRLENMLRESGFENVKLVNKSKTTSHEQRTTNWMTFDSLADFLDPENSDKTVEGYQAPVRACMIAKRPMGGLQYN